MKKLFVVLVMLTLTACGAVDRSVATMTGYSQVCVNGVLYLQFTSGATVAYTPEGKVRTCS